MHLDLRNLAIICLFTSALNVTLLHAADELKKVPVSLDLEILKKPIEYLADDSQDRISLLRRKLQNQEVKFEYSNRFGYLPALLKELEIPISSQLLRHNSMGIHGTIGGRPGHIGPHRPLAFYFDDDVVVSSFAESDQLEIAAQDSQKGIRFYSMNNRKGLPPQFELNGIGGTLCLSCHNSDGWLHSGVGAPGHIVQSELNLTEAQQYSFGNQMTHTLPIELRWNSRYVTGLVPTQKHRGNLVWEKDIPEPRQVTDIAKEFDTAIYPVATSDAVAHLVFDHLMAGQNLLARLSYEHQARVRSKIDAMVIRYLLFADEAPLDHPIQGKSDYAEWYQSRGPKTADGRSLVELDLETRLFRHRISPLVQSRVVENFPVELKQSMFSRLNDVLAGKVDVKGYQVSKADREATLAVLRGTIPDWPSK